MIATVTRASLGPRADTDPSPPSRQDMIVALGIPAFIVLCIGAALIHFIYWRLRRKGKADAGHACESRFLAAVVCSAKRYSLSNGSVQVSQVLPPKRKEGLSASLREAI